MVKTGESAPYGGSVWTRQNVTATVAPPPTAAYRGCFSDQGDPEGTAGRNLSGAMWRDGRMTTEACLGFCQQRGFAYAATQYGTYCFCGNGFGRSGPSRNCNSPCAGNGGQTCGGAWANSVHQLR
ncbi:MAG TPA: WSC domain-containing protein [Vicinamibacteria bacterium]|nr:WSC domain-containing protein [Vicinamibacteria bacterium]